VGDGETGEERRVGGGKGKAKKQKKKGCNGPEKKPKKVGGGGGTKRDPVHCSGIGIPATYDVCVV